MASRPSRPRTGVLPVAFTGAPGAYSQMAARRYFGPAKAGLTSSDACDAVRAVAQGRASHAVLPVENAITGFFAGVADAFFEGDVWVVGEIELPIRHCLLGTPQARLEEIAVVTSHPSALAQCRDWLTSWGVATRPSGDTALAAQELAAAGDRALGVLGSRDLATTYGLEILAEGLSDRPDNRTRFLVLAREAEETGDTGRRSAVRVGPITAPRALKTLRIQLESLGAIRVRVPFLGSEDGRRMLVEFDHAPGAGAEITARACGNLVHRFLGSWDAAVRAGNGVT